MASSSTSRAVRSLTATDGQRLQNVAQAVIQSAGLSVNSTGRNWRRLPTTPISEHYLTEYPTLTSQQIALQETLEEVERMVAEHELDLSRIDDTKLQETIEDVLNDILDVMVHDAKASSSSDDGSDDDSDDRSDSDYPPKSNSTPSNSASDAMHVRQAHRPHHEAGHANNPNPSRASPSRNQGPQPDALYPVSVPAEHVSPSNVEEPQQRNGIPDEASGGGNCCSTM